MKDMPFLSLDPDYAPHSPPPPDPAPARSAAGVPLSRDAGFNRQNPGPPLDREEDIVDLTEADMLASPLLQQIPDPLLGMDTTLRYAAAALAGGDAWGVAGAAARIADRAEAFGLHDMAGSARSMEEAAKNQDVAAAAKFLSALQAEVERNRRAG
jgi:hypothetical protein